MRNSSPLRPTPGSIVPALTFDDWEDAGVIAQGELAELFQALDKAAKAHRLYQENNPVRQGFQATLHGAFSRLWDRVASLQVHVDEYAFRCLDHSFPLGEGRDNLAFLFYRDGIRLLVFMPGFQDEAVQFLGVINRARQLHQKSTDDMVTLLWEQEFTAFQYSYVDLLAEGLQLPQAAELGGEPLDPSQLRAEIEGRPDEVLPPAVAQGAPPVALSVTPTQFVETVYFLEPHELEALQREVELEWKRDTKAAVLDALFDRLEDPLPERQLEILRILRQLMPVYLSSGDLSSASHILVELSAALEIEVLEPREQTEVQDLFRELSEPRVLAQLLASLSEGSIDPAEADLSVFLSHLGAGALPLLIHAAETTDVAQLKRRLRIAIEGLGQEHREALLELIGSEDQAIARGAARLAGQVGLATAAPHIVALFKSKDATTRRVAAESLVRIRSGAALAAVLDVIEDEDREVRIVAARGLGAVRYQPARARLEDAIQSKRLADADLTEQIAFFEAFGALGSADSVKLLDRLLNGRKLFGKQSVEIRACAAMALGRMDSPAARTALTQAAADPHPMVRSAVAKALAGEAPAR